MIALVVMTSGILTPSSAMAASITTATDTMSRLKASTASNHSIMFVTPTGVAAGQNITLTFTGFSGITGILYSDTDFGVSASGSCSGFSEKTLAGTASGTTWGVASAGSVVTITSGTDTVAAGRCVRIMIGTNAVSQTTGVNQISNSTAGTATIAIAGTFTDTGTISVSIIDDDSVTVTASVNQTMMFDIDTATAAATETSAPYTVPLGVLSAASVTNSNGTTINMITLEGDTNSSGGMNVSVRNANGTNGLVSTSTPADKIPNATATMSAGTANYGLCVASAGIVGYSRGTSYNTTCAVNSQTNGVVALSSTTPTDILTSAAPISGGHAEVVVNATISGSTPAHTDYQDVLTFIATASY